VTYWIGELPGFASEEISLVWNAISDPRRKATVMRTKILLTIHPEASHDLGRSIAGSMTGVEQVALDDPLCILTESMDRTDGRIDSIGKSTAAKKPVPEGEIVKAKNERGLQDIDNDTQTFAPGLGNKHRNIYNISDVSIEPSKVSFGKRYNVMRSNSDEDDLVTVAHPVGSPQESDSSLYPSSTRPSTPEQDAYTISHPSDRDESMPGAQKILEELENRCGHSAVPARRRSLRQAFHPFTVPSIALLLLGLFAPNGVGAAPILDHQNSSRRALLSIFATEAFVLLPSIALLLCIARKFLQGRNQRNALTVPVYAILIWVLPLSMFAFKDVYLGSSDVFAYAAVIIALVLVLVGFLFNATSQSAVDRGCSDCSGEGCAQCGGGGSSSGDP